MTAGGPSVPEPLVRQLADPGIMIVPVGAGHKEQHLVMVQKENGTVVEATQKRVAFVDLVGNHGWRDG